MNESWIKLFRKFREWEWYDDIVTKSVWLEILLTANFENKSWHGIPIKRGQLLTSIQGLREGLKGKRKICPISTQQMRTALEHLKLTNEITMSTTSNYTLITINKYEDYQESTKKITNEQQSNNKVVTTTKERKKERIKEYNKYIEPNLLNKDFEEISTKYEIRLKDVIEKYERMTLWYQEDPLKHKKLNWKATLMNWLREDIKSKKINKIQKLTEIPVVEKISEEQRQQNLKKIQDIKNGKQIKTTT